jgi:hypothetical protein
MQFERFYSLNQSVVAWFAHLQRVGFQPSQIWGSICGGNVVSVKPYAHPESVKVLKPLIYVSHGCGMQFEKFYRLNKSVVA